MEKLRWAEAIAETLAVPFFVVRYDAMIGSYLGETAGRLKRIFDYVRTTPCVLFFDEFDAVGKERGDIHETGEIKRVVTSLLMNVDELLDRAVWRRFQLRLSLPAPTEKQLIQYFECFFELIDDKPGFTPATMVKRLGALSYAEAEEFTLDIRRREILAMKERPLKEIIERELQLWEVRAQPSRVNDKEEAPSNG